VSTAMFKQTAAYRILKKWLKLLSSCRMHKTNKIERIQNAVHKIRGKDYMVSQTIRHVLNFGHLLHPPHKKQAISNRHLICNQHKIANRTSNCMDNWLWHEVNRMAMWSDVNKTANRVVTTDQKQVMKHSKNSATNNTFT
jgi:hypothetical protein